MTIRTKRTDSTNKRRLLALMGRAWGSMGEYGWWENWEFLTVRQLFSWVKYGGNMKGMGKCIGM